MEDQSEIPVTPIRIWKGRAEGERIVSLGPHDVVQWGDIVTGGFLWMDPLVFYPRAEQLCVGGMEIG